MLSWHQNGNYRNVFDKAGPTRSNTAAIEGLRMPRAGICVNPKDILAYGRRYGFLLFGNSNYWVLFRALLFCLLLPEREGFPSKTFNVLQLSVLSYYYYNYFLYLAQHPFPTRTLTLKREARLMSISRRQADSYGFTTMGNRYTSAAISPRYC